MSLILIHNQCYKLLCSSIQPRVAKSTKILASVAAPHAWTYASLILTNNNKQTLIKQYSTTYDVEQM